MLSKFLGNPKDKIDEERQVRLNQIQNLKYIVCIIKKVRVPKPNPDAQPNILVDN